MSLRAKSLGPLMSWASTWAGERYITYVCLMEELCYSSFLALRVGGWFHLAHKATLDSAPPPTTWSSFVTWESHVLGQPVSSYGSQSPQTRDLKDPNGVHILLAGCSVRWVWKLQGMNCPSIPQLVYFGLWRYTAPMNSSLSGICQ